jgi:hypothetical protein
MGLIERLRLALSKGPIREGVSLPSLEDGSRPNIRSVVISSYLKFQTIDKVHELSDSERNNSLMIAIKRTL